MRDALLMDELMSGLTCAGPVVALEGAEVGLALVKQTVGAALVCSRRVQAST